MPQRALIAVDELESAGGLTPGLPSEPVARLGEHMRAAALGRTALSQFCGTTEPPPHSIATAVRHRGVVLLSAAMPKFHSFGCSRSSSAVADCGIMSPRHRSCSGMARPSLCASMRQLGGLPFGAAPGPCRLKSHANIDGLHPSEIRIMKLMLVVTCPVDCSTSDTKVFSRVVSKFKFRCGKSARGSQHVCADCLSMTRASWHDFGIGAAPDPLRRFPK
jgi:hypothetical protein